MSLIFDASNHAYYLNGKQIPSVTQIIKGAGLMPDYSHRDMSAAEYGILVHNAVADLITGKPISVDPFVECAVMGFKAWQKLYNPQFILCEKLGVSEKYGYAGTGDIGAIIGKNKWLIDVKTGDYNPWHIVQLAGYNEIFKEEKFNRFGDLYLDPVDAGKFTFKEFKRAEILGGFSVFLNALNINKWKNK